jgi:hypothetical protein
MRRLPIFWLAAMCLVLVNTNGCGKSANVPQKDSPSNVKLANDQQVDESPSLVFDIKSSQGATSTDTSQTYDCTYQARGKIAKFRFQFIPGGAYGGETPLVSAEGKFLAVAGSDDSVLLEDLKTALEAKHPAKNFAKSRDVAFDAVILGQKQSRDLSGSFSDNPPGDWIATKIFLPKGGDDGEVYFNFNPVLGKAEFSIKDSDYGDYVLKELAKVL